MSFDWDAFFEAETNDEKFAAGADMFKMFGGSMAAGKTPPAAHYGGNTGVSAIDFSKRAQVSGLLGTMGTDDEYWKTILGS